MFSIIATFFSLTYDQFSDVSRDLHKRLQVVYNRKQVTTCRLVTRASQTLFCRVFSLVSSSRTFESSPRQSVPSSCFVRQILFRTIKDGVGQSKENLYRNVECEYLEERCKNEVDSGTINFFYLFFPYLFGDSVLLSLTEVTERRVKVYNFSPTCCGKRKGLHLIKRHS